MSCAKALVEVLVTLAPLIISPITPSKRPNAAIVYFASVIFVIGPEGPTFVDLTSSPSTTVFSGTIIGPISLYCPVLILIVFCGTYLAGILSALPAAIASVMIFKPAASTALEVGSAINVDVLYCETTAVELSPFVVW